MKLVPEHYIFVTDYDWPYKDAAKIHAKRFEDGICRWNPIVNKYEVFRPEYSNKWFIMFHELWIIFQRPFSEFEAQTCTNILADFDVSKLTTTKPELLWGRFFVPDTSGWITQDEAEESAEELCSLINQTVNIEYEFEHR